MRNEPLTTKEVEIQTIVHVSREYGELAGAGGIKDVTEGLCKATAAKGIDTHVFMPFYRSIKGRIELTLDQVFDVAMNYANQKRIERVTTYTATLAPNLTVHLVDAMRYQYLAEMDGSVERDGIYTYTKTEASALGQPGLQGKGYVDFFAMNVLLVKATLHALGKMKARPSLIHCHDGHAALLPLIAQASEEDFAAHLRYTPTLITIHNAGKGYHQEISDLQFAAAVCGLPYDIVSYCILNGNFDPLLAGGLFGSAINAVSENYAKELQCTGQDRLTGWLGHALAGYGIRLLGVTNGVDSLSQIPPHWNGIENKEAFKKNALEALMRGTLPKGVTALGRICYKENIPLLTFIGRLDEQKGFDILALALDSVFADDKNVQLLGLGDGPPNVVAQYDNLVAKYGERFCILKGYNLEIAKKIYAAGDFFLVPSRFEPCGLTDFFAQLAGNIPIVHSVGGLVKTVDGRFGFAYLGAQYELSAAIRRALSCYREPGRETLRRMQKNAVENIRENFTWDQVLDKKYLPLYRRIVADSRPALPY